MRIYDIILTLIIILIFIIIYFFNIISIGKNQINKEWPKYRCNPSVMPFASYFGHDTMSNFTYCIQTMQKNFMSYLLEPVHYSLGLAHQSGKQSQGAIQEIRNTINQTRNFVTSIIKTIYGVFLNILIEFQYTTIKLKDLGAKVIGIATTFMFLIDSLTKSFKSIWAGPMGKTLRMVCFDPNTTLVLKDGKKKAMKDIILNDVLENGSKVIGVLSLKNSFKETLYKIYSKELGQSIYVTGSHLIQDEDTKGFIPVKHYKHAESIHMILDTLSCLITDDHIIKIGEHTFWDYED